MSNKLKSVDLRIETYSDIPRKSSVIFGNRSSENDQKRSYNLWTVFGKFSKIFGKLVKIVVYIINKITLYLLFHTCQVAMPGILFLISWL